MKTKWAILALGLALTTAAPTGLQAQQQRGHRGDRAGAHAPGDAGRLGPQLPGVALERRIMQTLDQASELELTEGQVEALEALRLELLEATRSLREQVAVTREAHRATMQRMRDDWQPLPDEPQARAEAIEERQQRMQTLREGLQAAGVQLREQVQEVVDPLRQRYEATVPPSQRPDVRGAERTGRRGPRAMPGVGRGPRHMQGQGHGRGALRARPRT